LTANRRVLVIRANYRSGQKRKHKSKREQLKRTMETHPVTSQEDFNMAHNPRTYSEIVNSKPVNFVVVRSE